jgi:pilus assembly protein CpaE
MTNVLAVAVDHQLLDRIAEFKEHRLVAIDRDNVASIREHMPDISFHPDLILVGADTPTVHAVAYVRRVLAAFPTMAVMLVGTPDPELARQATEAGIRGVVRSTMSDRELANLLHGAGMVTSDDDPIGHQRHQVIVVASPKGGVGKTTIAVNLAALLAEYSPGEVVLLDLDLQFGDVATVLDLEPEYTVADALSSSSADSMLLRTLLVAHPAGFHVLCGAEHPAETGAVSGDLVRKLVSQFSSTFRYVVVDTSAGLQEETLASLEEATDVAFIATLDVATLRDLRKEVDVLAHLGLLPEHRHVVLNRFDRVSGLTERDAANIIGLPVDAAVPASSKITLAGNHARLAVENTRRNVARQPLLELTYHVSDRRTKRTGRHR